MTLASGLAGPDNAVPSLPGSDNWLSKKTQKNPSLFLHILVKLHFRCCRNILDLVELVINKHASVAITAVYRCIRFVPSPYTVLTFDLSHFRVRSLVFLF